MRTISINQPFANLIVKGYKKFETRKRRVISSDIIGQRLLVASSKKTQPHWRNYYESIEFQKFYARLDEPVLGDLPLGVLVGSVVIDSCLLMTEELIATISDEEKAYGEWMPGNYAWTLREPEYFTDFPNISGSVGFWDYKDKIPHGRKANFT